MKTSVIAVTARMGCFDLLVHSMEDQTFPKNDFEVVVVDSYYEQRRDLIKDRLPKNFRHVGLPEDRPFYDACYANNVGTRESQGELLIYFSDLNWAYPDFVSDHWEAFKLFDGYSMTGYCDRYPIPQLRPDIDPRRMTKETAWSVFDEEFDAEYAERYFSTEPQYREQKGGVGESIKGTLFLELPGDKWYGSLNESIPRSVIEEIGGWDQRYDGAYGIADIDLGVRANMAGWKFLVNPQSVTRKLGQKSQSGIVPARNKPQTRSLADNWTLFADMKRTGIWRVPEGSGLT